MKEITAFRLSAKTDTGDGFVARFATAGEAEKAAPHAGGYPPGEVREETIIIYDTAIEWRPSLDTAAVESGLAKLTREEIAALGLGSLKP